MVWDLCGKWLNDPISIVDLWVEAQDNNILFHIKATITEVRGTSAIVDIDQPNTCMMHILSTMTTHSKQKILPVDNWYRNVGYR